MQEVLVLLAILFFPFSLGIELWLQSKVVTPESQYLFSPADKAPWGRRTCIISFSNLAVQERTLLRKQQQLACQAARFRSAAKSLDNPNTFLKFAKLQRKAIVFEAEFAALRAKQVLH